MSFIEDFITGGDQVSKQEASNTITRRKRQPFKLNTGLSSLNATADNNVSLNIDPSINSLRDNALMGIQKLIEGIGSDANTLRGIQSPLVSARLRPLEHSINERRGTLTRDLGRRNVFGSFRNNSLNNFDIQSGQAVGDAKALATNDILNAVFSRQQAQAGLEGQKANIANHKLGQELSALGLSQNAIAALLASELQTGSTGTQTNTQEAGQINASDVGRVASAIGSFGFF